MKIAIVGSGVAGNVAAYRLHREHNITVFEADDRPGGHTHTHVIEIGGREYHVDTGFIVFNDWTYPSFIELLAELGVGSQPSHMSFSVRCERSGLEYNGTSLNSLFAQRRNLLRPSFHRMLRDILRFNREAPRLLAPTAADISLGEYLQDERYSREFIDHYLVPMGAAIWSAQPRRMLEMPAHFLIHFFHNHGMLSVNRRPQWRVIRGGSQAYLQ
ncbi:MAG: NAD(P)/FAD-dependent oxidoreductase, partial [Burkholderiales bacterium]